eukprot:Pgem_evm1s8559
MMTSNFSCKWLITLTLTVIVTFCNAKITVENRQLSVDGKVFHIKGVNWNPVNKGQTQGAGEGIDFIGNVDLDSSLMVEAKINCIRTYVPLTDTTVLDKVRIYVINTVLPNADTTTETVISLVNSVKTHPAILMWSLGNEWNYNKLYTKNEFSNGLPDDQVKNKINAAAAAIKRIDSNHPVATVYGDIPPRYIVDSMPNIDIW